MHIDKVRVYDMDETIQASGYPMGKGDLKPERLTRLGRAKPASGHDCALKGVLVSADVTAPQYWWLQFQRYHFADIVSSESKMHKITEMNISTQCNSFVDYPIVKHLETLVNMYNINNKHPDREFRDRLFQRIVANCPMGLMFKARITTNYLQLKNMYYQRCNHKLMEWQVFCDWVLSLPSMAKILKKEEEICE